MSDQLACEKFGRKDLNYQFWRWQPHHCDLPRSVQPQIYILKHINVRSALEIQSVSGADVYIMKCTVTHVSY